MSLNNETRTGPLDDLNGSRSGFGDAQPLVSGVSEEAFDKREARHDSGEQERRTLAVLHAGRTDELARLLREGTDAELEAFAADAELTFASFAHARGPKAVEAARALYPQAVERADVEYRQMLKAETGPARADIALEAFERTAAALVEQARQAVLAQSSEPGP
jgi:hypothetical protein